MNTDINENVQAVSCSICHHTEKRTKNTLLYKYRNRRFGKQRDAINTQHNNSGKGLKPKSQVLTIKYNNKYKTSAMIRV